MFHLYADAGIPWYLLATSDGRNHPEVSWYLTVRFGVGLAAVALTLVLLWRAGSGGTAARSGLIVTLGVFPVLLTVDLALTLFVVFIGGLVDALNSIDGSAPDTSGPLAYLLYAQLASSLALGVWAVVCAVQAGSRPAGSRLVAASGDGPAGAR